MQLAAMAQFPHQLSGAWPCRLAAHAFVTAIWVLLASRSRAWTTRQTELVRMGSRSRHDASLLLVRHDDELDALADTVGWPWTAADHFPPIAKQKKEGCRQGNHSFD